MISKRKAFWTEDRVSAKALGLKCTFGTQESKGRVIGKGVQWGQQMV